MSAKVVVESMHLADKSVGIIGESAIVGGGIPLATGVGLSAKVRGTDQVCLCFFGDGAVNQGTFHESLNMASLWKLPVIYLCENNRYAITTSVGSSHGQPDIAKRAEGYGMLGICVDGQDVGAVYEATRNATARARKGQGPTLIEARTYRFDEARGRSGRCPESPIVLPRKWSTSRHIAIPLCSFEPFLVASDFTDVDLNTIESEVTAAVAEAVRFGEESPLPDPATLFRLYVQQSNQLSSETTRLRRN